MKPKSDYVINAEKTLADMGIEFSALFLEHGKHFDSDKESRDIYELSLTRGKRTVSFRFGQSLNCSGKYLSRHSNKAFTNQPIDRSHSKNSHICPGYQNWQLNPNFSTPTSYDLLACLTKYPPGAFEDFCSEFGYDTDSRRAEKTYQGCVEEYFKVCAIFSPDELEIIQEIQ